LTHNEEPRIDIDGLLKLIYVGDLSEEFIRIIANRVDEPLLPISHQAEKQVSVILNILRQFREDYLLKGIIPETRDRFELQLFNTFRCYMDIRNHYPVKFRQNTDDRGSFVELLRTGSGGQVSFSTTIPGITRGNHFHTRKVERFAVIRGSARIQLRRIGTSEIINFDLSGESPSFVDMPVWYTHNITNTGDDDLYTVFWINEPYDPKDPDTWFEKV
jgi:UDP-2-acetamido-2,6-beta-L-arabino-hexul-4-ose reductase